MTIPNSVTDISHDAFIQCSNATFYCEAESKPENWVSGWTNRNENYIKWGCKVLNLDVNNTEHGSATAAGYTVQAADGSMWYLNNAQVTMTATPNEGCHVIWEDNSTDNVRSFTATESKTYTATFEAHVEEIDAAYVAATCTETGLTEGKRCSECGAILVAQEEIPALGHNYGTPTYEWGEGNSTCTATKVCANDNEHVVTETVDATSSVTVAATCEAVGTRTFTAEFTDEGFATQQKTEDIAATGHTAGEAVAENNVAPTCTVAGSVDSVVYCTVCESEISRKPIEIPATGHKEAVDAAVAATCTAAGKTEGKHCSVCYAELVAQEEIAATGHKEVVDAAVAATCTAAGKTEGKHCEVCNAVLVAQEDIPALGHDFKTYTFDNNATTEADGTETALCEHGCGTTDTRTAAGTKIATTPEKGTAVAESAANAVSIYTQNNIIVVENATAEIRIYDAMGRLIVETPHCDVSTEIRINTAGVYIVRVGNVAKRVMINN